MRKVKVCNQIVTLYPIDTCETARDSQGRSPFGDLHSSKAKSLTLSQKRISGSSSVKQSWPYLKDILTYIQVPV